MIDVVSDQQGPYGARKLLANSTAMSLTARPNPERDFQASLAKLDD